MCPKIRKNELRQTNYDSTEYSFRTALSRGDHVTRNTALPYGAVVPVTCQSASFKLVGWSSETLIASLPSRDFSDGCAVTTSFGKANSSAREKAQVVST